MTDRHRRNSCYRSKVFFMFAAVAPATGSHLLERLLHYKRPKIGSDSVPIRIRSMGLDGHPKPSDALDGFGWASETLPLDPTRIQTLDIGSVRNGVTPDRQAPHCSNPGYVAGILNG